MPTEKNETKDRKAKPDVVLQGNHSRQKISLQHLMSHLTFPFMFIESANFKSDGYLIKCNLYAFLYLIQFQKHAFHPFNVKMLIEQALKEVFLV